jgi:hypothetical protein
MMNSEKFNKLNKQSSHLVNFMMALTESSLVSLRALIASAFEHFVYYITILMLSGVSPYSETYSPATY